MVAVAPLYFAFAPLRDGLADRRDAGRRRHPCLEQVQLLALELTGPYAAAWPATFT